MITVEKKKQVDLGFKHAQSSLSWALHTLQCKGKPARYYFFSAFLLKKKKKNPKHRAGSVWMLIYIQWDSHLPVLLVQSLEQMLKSSLQKVTCASIFQLWDATFPVEVFRIRVRAFCEGGRERGSDLFIQVSVKLPLTCDTLQGLLALPAG